MTSGATDQQIRVLIVDDTATTRVRLRRLIESDPELAVMAMAEDAYDAVQRMRAELPDVLLMDVDLPGIDGLTFLRQIMRQHPLPVVLFSGQSDPGSGRAAAAIEAGAVEVISGVALDDPAVLRDQAPRLRESIKMAAFYCAATPPRLRARALPLPSAPKLGPDEILPPPNPFRAIGFDAPVVCIGASTGGTEALREVLCALPPTCPPILVVQHMPRSFTTTFAKGMNTVANIRVREAEDGMTIGPGQAVIATGDRHLLLSRRGQHYAAEVRGGPSVSRHRPSVDVLFRSAASVAGRNVLGVLMTGMGSDGAQCLGEILSCGGMTIAQDQRTSVVFGMPGEAVRLGHAQHVLPLDRIAGAILAFGQGRLSLGGAA